MKIHIQTPLSGESRTRIHQIHYPRSWRARLVAPLVLGCSCLALFFAPPAASAQTFSIDWYKVAGGGGTSTGSVYSVSGAVGQPDAGLTMSGGNFSLTGGFWALYAVQTPGAPLLRIFLTSTNTAVVSWPSPSTGFSLQQNTNVSTANWVTPAETINNNGTINFIIVTPPTANRFYRLKSP